MQQTKRWGRARLDAGFVVSMWIGVAVGCGPAREDVGEGSASSRPATSVPAPSASSAMDAPFESVTPNEILQKPTQTIVVGTLGSDRQDAQVLAQAELVRAMVFPQAHLKTDEEGGELDGAVLLYGGPHVNAVTKSFGLPFELGHGSLKIGGATYEGDDFFVIAAIPESYEAPGKQHPRFILYAGTGNPGVGEINSISHGGESILIADRFGRLRTGRWQKGEGGELVAKLDPEARRIAWRPVERELPAGDGWAASVATFHFPEQLEPAANEDAMVDGCAEGLQRTVSKLAIESPPRIDVYVYPDPRSKQSLTGKVGAGHAVVAMDTLHVLALEPAELESLCAHEGAHVFAYDRFPPPRTSMMGEGLAVWVAGRYAGKPLAAVRIEAIEDRPPLAELMGPAFRSLPEETSYPLAGRLVSGLIDEVGLDAFRDHLMGASAATWAEAVQAAGLDAGKIDAIYPPPAAAE